jgi:hypothetical protein
LSHLEGMYERQYQRGRSHLLKERARIEKEIEASSDSVFVDSLRNLLRSYPYE